VELAIELITEMTLTDVAELPVHSSRTTMFATTHLVSTLVQLAAHDRGRTGRAGEAASHRPS